MKTQSFTRHLGGGTNPFRRKRGASTFGGGGSSAAEGHSKVQRRGVRFRSRPITLIKTYSRQKNIARFHN